MEGWHNGLKNLGHRDMPFYRLIETLERESRWTSVSCRLVRESKLENMFSFYRSINIYINNCILQPKNILKELLKPKGVYFELFKIYLHDEVASLHVALCSQYEMDQFFKWNTTLQQLREILYVNLC